MDPDNTSPLKLLLLQGVSLVKDEKTRQPAVMEDARNAMKILEDAVNRCGDDGYLPPAEVKAALQGLSPLVHGCVLRFRIAPSSAKRYQPPFSQRPGFKPVAA